VHTAKAQPGIPARERAKLTDKGDVIPARPVRRALSGSFFGEAKKNKKKVGCYYFLQRHLYRPSFLLLFFLIKKEAKKSRQNECSAVLPCQRHVTSILLIHSTQSQYSI